MEWKLSARLMAPYLAVGLFWCGLSSGWLAILAYHAQILFWARGSIRASFAGGDRGFWWLALPAAVAGPLVYLLLPVMVNVDLGTWLEAHGLVGLRFLAIIPYFGVVHPLLEQIHWAPLRARTPLAHPLFAGYHMLVLVSLLKLPWLIVCFVVLTSASFLWQWLVNRDHSLTSPALSHILADLGMAVAAWLSL